MKQSLILLSLHLFIFSFTRAQDTARTESNLTAATVFFGYGAELTHEAKVKVNSSTRTIVISKLSTSIDVNSLQINIPENTALLSQQFSVYTPPVAPPVANLLIKKIQDTLAMIKKQQSRLYSLSETEREVLAKTNELVQLAMKDLNSKIISSEEYIKLINLNTAKIEKSRQLLFKNQEDMNANAELITQLEERINQASEQPVAAAKSYGQLVLQVMCRGTEDLPISFSYFTQAAGFTPLYDVRVNSKNNEMKLVYKASITQNTGIDWKQVKLTLSTANPSWGGVAPLLTPWYLQQYVPQLYNKIMSDDKAFMATNSIQSIKDVSMNEVVVTTGYGIARKQQMNPVTVDPSSVQRYTTLSESQLNTNFEIDLPYNIASNGEIHSVTIREEKINAGLKNYAVPKMDKDAYLLAEIANWQELNLLPGTANIIMDNTYIGKSMIDPNSTADTLNLSLGKDKRLAVKRTAIKEYTSSKTNGNTSRQTFTYELLVKNNKQTSVDMLLKDQYPISNVKDIEVKLEDSGDAMVNTETGVLTWKLALAPGESKKVRFTYTVKYPKEIRIANL